MLTQIEEYSMQGSIIETIFLPKNVNNFAANCVTSRTLKAITCNPSNPTFSVMDGILYNKEKTMLVKYPANHGTSFEIPETVTKIGYCAFINSGIETILFPSNLKLIEGWAFSYTDLKTLKIPDSVTGIYDGCFYSCKCLTDITLGTRMTFIPFRCFGLTKLTKIIIPDNITLIGDYAFSDCPNLKEVVLPSTITNLGGSCFPTNVNISFPSDAKLSLDDQQILYDLDKIVLIMCLKKSSSYIIPETVSTIRASAFKDMTDLTKIEFRSGTTLKTIESNAFFGCIKLSSIEIPNSVTSFGEKSFYHCVQIKSVFFGSKLTKISTRCFEGCTSLDTVSFSQCNSPCTIDSYAFSGCTSLRTLTLSENISSIDMYCFSNCASLERVNIPSTLKYIGIYAFSNSIITQVTFSSPSQMVNLSKYSFSQCIHLRDIVGIPETIENIESNCFESTQITSFDVPISTTSIGNYAFRGCSEMTVFRIPSRCLLQTIGNYIFDGCVSLSKIECPDSDFFVIDNGALFNKNRSNLICFPPASSITFFCFSQNVRSVSSSAFYGCKSLVGIMIPDDSITTIGHSAFAYCTSLKYINIPLCVKSIDQNVFTGCNSLHCGVVVQNTSISFRYSLVTNSGLSLTSMKDCGLITCKHVNYQTPVSNSYLYVFILM
ncbi:cell surface protein, putative [Trichomonas vaginalis G3]|uniref:Cell surface protein, putative n=1 Tax=Trichomonas vaginalis (strain ATCC PRA-98 / G3) TaxID=412133 RepID=A2ES95_TRIV3|nr:regulation of response to stimulus [Trichomonas vaginalis G3]EAY04459.1 cell surface protein, putative [Trichomonas vaginalis G3]KAI5510283.1 regulation of response to stimulus [Trichomonas vaginalis G3]|eukprot:XP_001316682.1 cell surface protein [Trichomonas vaginalis G3]